MISSSLPSYVHKKSKIFCYYSISARNIFKYSFEQWGALNSQRLRTVDLKGQNMKSDFTVGEVNKNQASEKMFCQSVGIRAS